MSVVRKYLVAGAAATVFVLVGIGVFVASSQFSSTPPGSGSGADNAGSKADTAQDRGQDPAHDWEADPIIPDGKPSTPQEFAQDAQAGQDPNQAPAVGPTGVFVDGNDIVILPPKDPGHP